MDARNKMTTELAEREIIMVRCFQAPRAMVFRAWTDPVCLAKWWGPNGYTCPSCESNAVPGGRYRIVMRSPDGEEYPVVGYYLEVEEPSRLVMTNSAEEMPQHWKDLVDASRQAGENEPPLKMVMTIHFDNLDGGTSLTMTTTFESNEDRDGVLAVGAEKSWAETFDRLDDLTSNVAIEQLYTVSTN